MSVGRCRWALVVGVLLALLGSTNSLKFKAVKEDPSTKFGWWKCVFDDGPKRGQDTGVSFRVDNRKTSSCGSKGCTNKYRGATSNLLTPSDLQSVGYSSSEAKVLHGVLKGESGGKYGALNTWDRQIFSWGGNQASCLAGSLASVLAVINRWAPSEFRDYFTANGVGYKKKCVTVNETPGFSCSRSTRRSECQKLKENYGATCAFLVAGNNKEIAKGQMTWAIASMRRPLKKKFKGKQWVKYANSQAAAFALMYGYNWLPAWTAGRRNWKGCKDPALKRRFPSLLEAFVRKHGSKYNNVANWNSEATQKLFVRFADFQRADPQGDYKKCFPSSRKRAKYFRKSTSYGFSFAPRSFSLGTARSGAPAKPSDPGPQPAGGGGGGGSSPVAPTSAPSAPTPGPTAQPSAGTRRGACARLTRKVMRNLLRTLRRRCKLKRKNGRYSWTLTPAAKRRVCTLSACKKVVKDVLVLKRDCASHSLVRKYRRTAAFARTVGRRCNVAL